MQMLRKFGHAALGLALVMLVSVAPVRAADTVTIGTVGSPSANLWPLFIAIEKGFFTAENIKADLIYIPASAPAIQQVAAGSLDMSFSTGLVDPIRAAEQGAALAIARFEIQAPPYALIAKPSIKSLKDLKGKVVASNGQGSVSTYEVGKMLEREGLTINDVDLKVLPFTQMGIAFKNGAIDAGILIPPFVWQLEEQGLAVPFASVDDLVQPQPMTIAVIMANSEWVKANPDLVQRYMTAWLKGVREYCQAYHGGSNRQEVLDELVNSKTEPRRELLEKYPWPARSPNGGINVASMLDINKWYVKNKMSAVEFPADRVINSSFIDKAVAAAGPFQLQNKDSKLPGCR